MVSGWLYHDGSLMVHWWLSRIVCSENELLNEWFMIVSFIMMHGRKLVISGWLVDGYRLVND